MTKILKRLNSNSCKLPRSSKAKEALIVLAWKKQKSERPQWIKDQLKVYS